MSKKEMNYRLAKEELKSILEDIQSDKIDVDEVSIKVKRAVELIKFCKDKIEKTELEVVNILKEFDKDTKISQ